MIFDQACGNAGKMFNHVLRRFAGEESRNRDQRDRDEDNNFR